jgi:DNA-directed RNA polymerase omega subunit
MKDDITLINEVLEKIPNKYLAVIVASKRARAINDGLSPSVRTGATKPTTTAMEEIAIGSVEPGPAAPEIGAAEEEAEEEMLPPPNNAAEDEQ